MSLENLEVMSFNPGMISILNLLAERRRVEQISQEFSGDGC